MKTIAFLNMKGGVGKTTTSVNVATGIAMKGKRVLLVDFDPQSNATSLYDIDYDISISDVLKGTVNVKDSIKTIDDNLWLIPSSLDLFDTEIELRLQTDAPQHNRLKKALGQIQDQFDYCIIDCPPIVNLLTVNAILSSNLLIIPIKPEKHAVSGFNYTIKNVLKLKTNWELDLEFKVLFTIVNRNIEEQAIIEQITNLIPEQCFKTIIRSQPKPIVASSMSNKAVIKETSKDIPVAEDLRHLVTEIMGVI
ncbi:ParA family protein [Clostridium cochlearium]|uniref:ParA family protein n=1 Tax=Clostridium cochlearium TaxID=1494 RepID=UPI00241FA2FD|nr:AAA family ATPase [Clostridium cochlearium]MBE6065905.1 chromosome partitioning protein ParA [Clostridium cochlearium]